MKCDNWGVSLSNGQKQTQIFSARLASLGDAEWECRMSRILPLSHPIPLFLCLLCSGLVVMLRMLRAMVGFLLLLFCL